MKTIQIYDYVPCDQCGEQLDNGIVHVVELYTYHESYFCSERCLHEKIQLRRYKPRRNELEETE